MMRCKLSVVGLSLLLVGALATPVEAQGPRLNRTIETLEAGQPVFGIFTASLSYHSARALATSDLDFLFIDMEHSAFDVDGLRGYLQAMVNVRRIVEKGSPQMDVTPLVRIPMNGRENLQFLVKQVLDMGAFGVVFPFIETRAEALGAVQAMRYPQRRDSAFPEPRGMRGSSPGVASWFWGVPDYGSRADTWPLNPQGELLAVLQIESPEGVANIDAIASVPGVGAIFIGPADLALSYGVPGNHPEVVEAIATVLAACKRYQVPCGLTTNQATVEQRLAEGFSFVTVGYWNDAGISPAPAEALATARRAAGRER